MIEVNGRLVATGPRVLSAWSWPTMIRRRKLGGRI